MPDSNHPEMPRRPLGRTGETVSLIGLGGYHLAQPSVTEPDAIRLVRTAIDRGVNFLDNSWDYHDGESERRVGKALRDGYRDRAFVMTKIDGRDRKTAAEQIDESLRRLAVDRIDLLQFHEVIRWEDPDRIFAAGGAAEAVLAAREAGKVRYVGFTGHKSPDIHLKMLAAAATHDFPLDTVQMPLNVMDAHYESFERKVLPELVASDIAVLGMKPFGGSGDILERGVVAPIECLHYVMNLPVSVVITGCDSMDVLEQALEAAATFHPLHGGRRADILSRTAEAGSRGTLETYKTTREHDSTAEHPQWLGR
jgi:aryl-alcohol dehydrogenase-like predicted oxidoreductase